MILFVICLCLTIPAMLTIDRWVRPKTDKRFVLHRVSLLITMPSIMYYTTIFMITYRPFFSFGVTVITMITIVIFNNAKYDALQEPLVFSDFALLRQIFTHPALYVSYIGVWNIVLVVAVSLGLVWGAMVYEPPVIARHGATDYFPMAIYLSVVLGLIYAMTRGPLRAPLLGFLYKLGTDMDVRRDVDRLSLVVCLVFYFFLADAPGGKAIKVKKAPPSSMPDVTFPAIVLVQNESFFDVRRIHASLSSDLLANWDRVRADSAYRGRLSVPAWGANTMRTEFAVLTGLPFESLGVHRFNPYLSLARNPTWSLAHQLRSLGYRTVCVHPYPADFFARDKVFPNLGFNEFIDISGFEGAERFGPYVSDKAVSEKILKILSESTEPTFVFAITMENHGSWRADRLDGVVPPEKFAQPPPFGSQEMAVYLHHLANADGMVAHLTRELSAWPGGAVLSMYGDHVPSFPDVFRDVGYEDRRTDYIVWRTGNTKGQTIDTRAENLGRLIIDVALRGENNMGASPVERG